LKLVPVKLVSGKGEMQEWFNWHAWKACVPQKGTGGSNPPLSAVCQPEAEFRWTQSVFVAPFFDNKGYRGFEPTTEGRSSRPALGGE
jgi:hypothetical protein